MSLSNKAVALTGGIGCGKTTVLMEFQKLGVPCFVADYEAKKLYHIPQFIKLVSNKLGPSILNDDGSIDRKEVARIVFRDSDVLAWLNGIIHPFVLDIFEQWRQLHRESPYVLFESAILYEAQIDHLFDKVICVYLDKEERFRRLAYRDHATREDLEARMSNQLSAEDKMMRADYVVLNHEGNPRRRQVLNLHNLLISAI